MREEFVVATAANHAVAVDLGSGRKVRIGWSRPELRESAKCKEKPC
jgi:hypothetical protein